jgi:hypothetical protein
MMGNDAIAWRKTADSIAQLEDLADDLMAQHRSGLSSDVPIEKVGSADAAGAHANQGFARADSRSGGIDDRNGTI